ncbi:uncharacterized protein LOC116426668 [Nomia melanderi]|uniref:uncharacterized protein LOC116426668 n=1 Tax=Nomia melanderi TaxID=2448451 RepID=UPI003FCD3710
MLPLNERVIFSKKTAESITEFNDRCGFKTAKGASINISNEALFKANQQFNDIEVDNDKIIACTANNAYESMKNKNINIMNKQLLNEKDIFSDERAVSTKNLTGSCGFKTAKGGSINISTEALFKANQQFNDIEVNNDKIIACTANNPYESTENQDSTVMNKQLLNEKNIFSDERTVATKKFAGSCGFKTAKGGSINISNEALFKANQQFNDIEVDNDKIIACTANNPYESMKNKNSNIMNKQLLNEKDIFSDEGAVSAKNLSGSCGFKTAKGASINISNEALFKANQQFNDIEVDNDKIIACTANNPYESMKNKNINIMNKQLLNEKDIFSDEGAVSAKNITGSCGFKTAKGASINISTEALFKANQQFNDIEVNNDKIIVCTANNPYESMKNKNSNIMNKQLLNEKDIFSDEGAVSAKNLTGSCGFKTAKGASINISNEALFKANQQFNDIEVDNDKIIACTANNPYESMKNKNSNIMNKQLLNEKDIFSDKGAVSAKNITGSCGFKTAKGGSINISNEALFKANQQFNDVEENDSELIMHTTNAMQFEDSTRKKNTEYNIHRINSKFQAVGDKYLITTNHSSKDSNMLLNLCSVNNNTVHALEMGKVENKQVLTNDEEDTIMFNMSEMPKFQTANGQNINIRKEDLLEARAIFYDRTIENCNNDPLLNKSLPKRKIKDLDDTSIGKEIISNQFKKLRFSNQFQVQKTVCKHSENSDRKNRESPSFKLMLSGSATNELRSNIYNTEKNKEDNTIDNNLSVTHEIVESAVALLADENSSDTFNQWVSPAQNKENDGVTNIQLSPVIGGQFVLKKRKNVGTRRKHTYTADRKENKFICTYNTNQLRDKHLNSDLCVKKETSLLVKNQESMNNIERHDTSVVNEFGDTQLILDFINESASILEKRLQTAVEQETQVKLKEKTKPRSTIGTLYFHRTNCNNRISWREISKEDVPIPCTCKELIERKLPPEILDLTAENAVTYKFRCSDFYGQTTVQNNIEGIQLADGACLILDENGYVGISEIKRSFLASPGVDPNLLPTGWVENHYRWIVWKLGSMDRVRFTSILLPRALTPARVMMELKYRYDREIDRSQRSALRKILEKDDIASKRMVLCVSSIIEFDNSAAVSTNSNHLKPLSKKLILTDGWYSIQATIDQAMKNNIIQGKVKEGTKLITYGSELLHCDQGCSPLEVPDNVCLKIHTNSTRRARWDTKLGYVGPSGPMCIKLKSICPYGGLVGKIKVLIARVYPILYHEKTSSGESIFRNARCEEKANIVYERECRLLIESFYAKAEKHFYMEKRQSNSDPDSIDLAAMEWTKDREKLFEEEFLSKQEKEQLMNKCRMEEENFRQKLEYRLQKSLPPPRQITPVLKIRVVEEETTAILSIWSPSEEITDILKEGNCISVCNVTPSVKRGIDLQLTANRNAVFNQINTSNKLYPQRMYTPLYDINKLNYDPAYGEFDTVGIVVYIGNEPYGMKNFQAAYLAHPNANFESSYLSVLFWNGISSYGCAEILTIGSPVACSNLEWRRAALWNLPMAYCTERSSFTQNPKQNHLQRPFEALKCLIMDTSSYVSKCAAEISEEVRKKSITRSSDQLTPDKNHLDKISSNKDCNYTFQETSESSLVNNTSVKSIAIQKRLERLQCYGEASSLSPIVLNSSKRVSVDFQSPVRTSTVKQTKAHMSLRTKFFDNSR